MSWVRPPPPMCNLPSCCAAAHGDQVLYVPMRQGLIFGHAGDGVLFNPAVGFELLRTAAERGDPEAQSELAFRLALGIYPPQQGLSSSFLDPLQVPPLLPWNNLRYISVYAMLQDAGLIWIQTEKCCCLAALLCSGFYMMTRVIN